MRAEGAASTPSLHYISGVKTNDCSGSSKTLVAAATV